jgi:hypothetical protein
MQAENKIPGVYECRLRAIDLHTSHVKLNGFVFSVIKASTKKFQKHDHKQLRHMKHDNASEPNHVNIELQNAYYISSASPPKSHEACITSLHAGYTSHPRAPLEKGNKTVCLRLNHNG